MTTEKKTTTRLPWAKREAGKILRATNTLERIVARCVKAQKNNPNEHVQDALSELQTAVIHARETIDFLDIVPDDYKPGGRRAKQTLTPGTVVKITAKHLETYEDLFEAEELEDLEILKINGNKLAVQARATDAKFFIPRGHVTVQTPTTTN